MKKAFHVLVLVLILMLAFPIVALAQSSGDPPPATFTPEMLASVGGIVLSLLFSYVPRLNTWFAALDGTYKRLIMLALMALVGAAAFGLSCAGWLGGLFYVQLTCDQYGIQVLIRAFIFASISNQTTYNLTPLPRSVKVARAS